MHLTHEHLQTSLSAYPKTQANKMPLAHQMTKAGLKIMTHDKTRNIIIFVIITIIKCTFLSYGNLRVKTIMKMGIKLDGKCRDSEFYVNNLSSYNVRSKFIY